MSDVPAAPYRVPLRSWLSAHGPFPQFRSALLDAEAYLNGFLTGATPQPWRAARCGRRQRQSVAVHLTALCLTQEFDIPAGRLPRLRQRICVTVLPRLGLGDWPHLEPPASVGLITVADVHRAVADDGGLARAVDAWPAEVWQAPPDLRGLPTAADVLAVKDVDEHERLVRSWAGQVWQAWAPHHATVRKWLVDGGYRQQA